MTLKKGFAIPFIFYNVFYLILSLIMILAGLFTRFFLSSISDGYNNYESFEKITLCFMIVGGIMVIVPFTSCPILIHEKTRSAVLYLLIMLAVTGVDLYFGYSTFEITKNIEKANNRILNETFENVKYHKTRHIGYTYDVIAIQLSLHCCGFDGPNYWTGEDQNTEFKMTNWCCEQANKTIVYDCSSSNSTWQNGCVQKSLELTQHTSKLLRFIILTVATIKVTGILFFLCKYEWNK